MADNIAVTTEGLAADTNYASDDVGGIQYPRAKVCWGADGVATDTSAAAPLPVVHTGALPAGGNAIGTVNAVGYVVNVDASFTRPADTTTYAAGDVVADSTSAATVMTFTNCARANAGSGVILGATLVDGANQTLKGVFDLFLFDTTVTMDNDNAVFTPTDAELATCVGVVSFVNNAVGDATAGAGGNAFYPNPLTGYLGFVTGASSRNLFGVLVARNAYVPVSAGTFAVRLRIAQN